MRRMICAAVLLFAPGVLLAAAETEGPSASGLWKVDGDVMGTPVKMMCSLTEDSHKLNGTCSGAADGYTAHKVAGTIKSQKVEFHFQTAIGGNSITLIVSGTLDEDKSKMDGTLDVEPMAVSGGFSAVKESLNQAPAAAAAAPTSEPAPSSEATPSASSTQPSHPAGTWNIEVDVQGTQVPLTCVFTETDVKLTGSCAGAGEDKTPRSLTGTIGEKGISWHFDSQFQEQPISVTMTATINADGSKMSGIMAVAPLNAEGTFVGVKQ
jgi:hypothetical protein